LNKDDFIHTKRHFPDENKFELMRRKGVYCYEHMTSRNNFEETELPSIETFFSKLRDDSISSEEYEHAQTVWREFNMKTLQDYHDAYLLSDVTLLADCFEKFRNIGLEYFSIDCAHCYTTPGFSWISCLKYTNVELELFTNIDQLLFVEPNIRGGISNISKRYSKPNNPLIPDYDQTKDHSWIMFLDANNLYGYALSERLPIGGYKWLFQSEIDKFDLMAQEDDQDEGYK